jgi:hypothetical protein
VAGLPPRESARRRDTFLTQKQRESAGSAVKRAPAQTLETRLRRTIHDPTRSPAKRLELLWEQGVASSNLAVPITGNRLVERNRSAPHSSSLIAVTQF